MASGKGRLPTIITPMLAPLSYHRTQASPVAGDESATAAVFNVAQRDLCIVALPDRVATVATAHVARMFPRRCPRPRWTKSSISRT